MPDLSALPNPPGLTAPDQKPEHKPEQKQKLERIEALRGVAAVAVVIYHVGRHIEKTTGQTLYADLFRFGHAGVDLFFVLSGFIILHVHRLDLGRPQRLGPYLMRRAVRVLPLYWIALLVTVLMVQLGGHGWPDANAWLQGLTLHPSRQEPLLGVAWTLTHEWLFYAAFGVALISLRWGAALMAAWTIGIMANSAGWLGDLGWPISILRPYNLEFLLGMAAALWAYRWPNARPRGLLLGGVVLTLLSAWMEQAGLLDGHGLIARCLYGPAALLLVIAAVVASRGDFARTPKWLLSLGAASYSIYLFQFIFIGVAWKVLQVAKLTPMLGVLGTFLALSLAGVVGGIAVSRWVEYPLLARLRSRQS